MTATDLAAICERYGITVFAEGVQTEIGQKLDVEYAARDAKGQWWGRTKADAVCALLKARWSIGTQRRSGSQTIDGRTEYTAVASGIRTGIHRTELAAVVALADRLVAR